jgi:hypothetical protein
MPLRSTSLFHRRFILPAEHGSWIWWIGPFIVGVAAAGRLTLDLLVLFLAMMAAFLLRQPLTIWVKTLSNRRAVTDRRPALIWFSFYSLIALVGFVLLLRAGFGRLVWLLLPGFPVFIWYLFLVSQRAERGQRGIEIVGAGVLALAAPASYWVAGGSVAHLAWILWGISWLQSAASIVLVYQRLHERTLDAPGVFTVRTQRAARSLAYHGFNLVCNLLAIQLFELPWMVALASGLMLLDAFDTLRAPAIGWKPMRIGLRQLLASILFVLITAAGFLNAP